MVLGISLLRVLEELVVVMMRRWLVVFVLLSLVVALQLQLCGWVAYGDGGLQAWAPYSLRSRQSGNTAVECGESEQVGQCEQGARVSEEVR